MNTFGAFVFVDYFISGAVIVQSTICKFIFIYMTKLIMFKDDSRRTSFALISVFSIIFLNYGVLQLLVPMKLKIPLLNTIFEGLYWDFN